MKIKAKVDFTHGTMAVMKGDVVNVDDHIGHDLINTGLVVLAKEQDNDSPESTSERHETRVRSNTKPDMRPAKHDKGARDEGGEGVSPAGAAPIPTRK